MISKYVKTNLILLILVFSQLVVLPIIVPCVFITESNPSFKRLIPVAWAASYSRKLIIHNEIYVEVTSVNEVKEKLRQLFSNKGYIASSSYNIDQSGNSLSNITLKVAAEAYPEVRKEIMKTGIVTKEEEKIEDIGNTYFDIQTNITTKTNYHNQLMQILAAQKKLETLVKLTELISEVQAEINEAKGILTRYDNEVRFATIDIYLTQSSKVKVINPNIVRVVKTKQPEFFWTTHYALQEGIYTLKLRTDNFINWIIYQVTANLLIWLIIIIIIALVIRNYRNNKFQLKSTSQKITDQASSDLNSQTPETQPSNNSEPWENPETTSERVNSFDASVDKPKSEDE